LDRDPQPLGLSSETIRPAARRFISKSTTTRFQGDELCPAAVSKIVHLRERAGPGPGGDFVDDGDKSPEWPDPVVAEARMRTLSATAPDNTP
jgi:hypothetical protein